MTTTTNKSELRSEWTDNWESYRELAFVCSMRYCLKRLKQYDKPQWEDIADEALSEAWRDSLDGKTPREAIPRAVNRITQDRARHYKASRPLPELPAHGPEYRESESELRQVIESLPTNLQPLATLLSADHERSNYELAELLDCSECTVRNQKKSIQGILGSRFGYLLLRELGIHPSRRLVR